jgi:hypothetical protein
MAFFDRRYHVYAAFGGGDGRVPWAEPQWSVIAAELDPLITAASGKAAVRSGQFAIDPVSGKQREVKFGRIGWHAAGHAKWVHREASTAVSFLSVEVWAPAWTECERRQIALDLYLRLDNQAAHGPAGAAPATVLLGVAMDMPAEYGERVYPSMRIISDTIGGDGIAHALRPWAQDFGGIGYTSALQDLFPADIFAVWAERAAPDGAALKEPWHWLD